MVGSTVLAYPPTKDPLTTPSTFCVFFFALVCLSRASYYYVSLLTTGLLLLQQKHAYLQQLLFARGA